MSQIAFFCGPFPLKSVIAEQFERSKRQPMKLQTHRIAQQRKLFYALDFKPGTLLFNTKLDRHAA